MKNILESIKNGNISECLNKCQHPCLRTSMVLEMVQTITIHPKSYLRYYLFNGFTI